MTQNEDTEMGGMDDQPSKVITRTYDFGESAKWIQQLREGGATEKGRSSDSALLRTLLERDRVETQLFAERSANGSNAGDTSTATSSGESSKREADPEWQKGTGVTTRPKLD